MKKLVFLLFLSLSVLSCQEKTQMPITEFSAADLKAGELLVDVRTPGEFNQGHLPGAVNIDWMAEDFIRQWDTVSRDKKLYLYCQAGVRSAHAARVLDSLGFRVVDLTGGYAEYLKARPGE
jgi:rhodanese-related sulfurtransferase